MQAILRLHVTQRRRQICACAVCLLIALSVRSAEIAVKLTGPPQIVPRVFFGMHMHRVDAGTPWPSIPFGTWRLLDAYVNWLNLQPARDRWDFAKLDRYVSLAENARVEILLPLAYAPAWASARPTEPGPYGPGTAAEPANLEDWRNYVRTVASRYRGRIRHFELWNEVNVRQHFSGSLDRLLEMEREAARVLKEVDPANLLISPSFVGEGRHREFDAYLAKGGGRAADIIGWHFYLVNFPPEELADRMIRPVREVMARHGLGNKPLWNTETGYRIENADGSAESFHVDRNWKMRNSAEAAAFVARALVLNWANGVERVYWYAWDNQNLGLIEPTTKVLKASARAYGATARWLVGARLSECVREAGGTWRCTLTRDPNRRAYLLWREDGESAYALPAEWNVQEVEPLLGSPAATKGATVTLGPLPVLAKADRLPWGAQ